MATTSTAKGIKAVIDPVELIEATAEAASRPVQTPSIVNGRESLS